jgi:lipoprotein signal peptidase
MNRLKILPILLYLWFIFKYGVNFPFLDDWTGIIPLVKQLYIKKLTLMSIWLQHTENRMFFPNIVLAP